MPTFVVDDPDRGFRNLYPLIVDGQDLTEPCWLTCWLDLYDIDYNTITVDRATPNSWYPISINFWNFSQDYLRCLPDPVLEKLSAGSIRVLFLYREADDPGRIRQHIIDLCQQHGLDPDLFWLISGNTLADHTPNSRFFWYFDVNYFQQTLHSPTVNINPLPREKKITCLSRVHKHWREWFVYNLWRRTNSADHYLSHSGVIQKDVEIDDINIWEEKKYRRFQDGRPINIVPPDWLDEDRPRADDLSTDQHNTHSLVIAEHFQNSYWNIVLETLLDTEVSGGVFVTEKTLKPIRNAQAFVILGCQHTLEFLKQHGYKTFNGIIDESYDHMPNIHDRWGLVYNIAVDLANRPQEYLEGLQTRCVPILEHNQKHFQRSRRDAVQNLTAYLDTI